MKARIMYMEYTFYLFPWFGCRFRTMKDTINLIREVHKKNIDIQSLAFQNFDEFVSWKQEEKNTECQLCADVCSSNLPNT